MHDLKKSRWILKKEKAFQEEAYEIFLFLWRVLLPYQPIREITLGSGSPL